MYGKALGLQTLSRFPTKWAVSFLEHHEVVIFGMKHLNETKDR